MTRPDESLIRDDDLKAKVAAERAKGMFPAMMDVFLRLQVEEQQRRDAKAAEVAARKAMKPLARRREIVREVISNEQLTPDALRYTHSVLALCGLPYRRLAEGVTEYERTNGKMAVTIQAGKLRAPDGSRIQQPVPYGPKARLLMAHLSSEAVRNNSATVEIADSLSAFMREMGIEPRGGERGTIQPFKDQVNALAACRIEMSAWDGRKARQVEEKPFKSVEVWFPTNPDERMLWPTTITFSEPFFQDLKRHAMPVNVHVLRHLANSARKLDLYFWLNYRLNSISARLTVPWSALLNQFGDGFTRERAFRAQLADELNDIKALFPKLPLTMSETGITLDPADPVVLGIPALKLPKKR
jgi:hypothetical protein